MFRAGSRLDDDAGRGERALRAGLCCERYLRRLGPDRHRQALRQQLERGVGETRRRRASIPSIDAVSGTETATFWPACLILRPPGHERTWSMLTRGPAPAACHHRARERERESRPEPGSEEQPLRLAKVRKRADRAAAVRVHLEVEVRMDPVRVAGVADVADRLARRDLRSALQPLRERDARARTCPGCRSPT